MAEVWADLKVVRLKLSDPSGVIALETVANTAALPVTPKKQTAYRTEDTGSYKTYDFELLVWNDSILKISDETLNNMIASYGADSSVPMAIIQIIGKVLEEMRIVSYNSGTETTQYQTLQSMLDFYKSLKAMYTEQANVNTQTSTGRMIRTKPPTIGGVTERTRWWD